MNNASLRSQRQREHNLEKDTNFLNHFDESFIKKSTHGTSKGFQIKLPNKSLWAYTLLSVSILLLSLTSSSSATITHTDLTSWFKCSMFDSSANSLYLNTIYSWKRHIESTFDKHRGAISYPFILPVDNALAISNLNCLIFFENITTSIYRVYKVIVKDGYDQKCGCIGFVLFCNRTSGQSGYPVW